MNKSIDKTKKVVAIGMFCALAFIISFCFPIKVAFLTFDAKDAIIAIGGMLLGPLSAFAMAIIVPFLELITNSTTGWYGFIMNFLSSAVFALTASLIYKHKRKMSTAIISLVISVVISTCVMLLANYFITPLYAEYMGFALDIKKTIPQLLLPFNLIKYVLNASLVLLLYKPITTAMRRTGLVHQTTLQKSQKKKRTTIITAVCAIVLIAACVLLYIFLFDAKFDFII